MQRRAQLKRFPRTNCRCLSLMNARRSERLLIKKRRMMKQSQVPSTRTPMILYRAASDRVIALTWLSVNLIRPLSPVQSVKTVRRKIFRDGRKYWPSGVKILP